MDNKLKIINYLGKNIGKLFTMHELSNLIRIPYATFHRTISKMSGLITKEKAGKAILIELNIIPIIKPYLAISSEEEKKEFLKKTPLISKIASEIESNDIVILFGSYAKKTENEKSDVDLMIINKDGSRSLSFSRYEMMFRKKINPIFITEKEFNQMMKEKEENVGKQVLANHIILNNPEKFWELVLNG
ncbi:MAG: nucleotidyltransferase domain-containing protein [Nanoarchaeota archaeon]